MIRPTKHPRTGIYHVRKAVPAALRGVVGKREWIENLGTKDPDEAKRLAPAAVTRIEAMHRVALSAIGTPRRLTQKELMAYAGEWYREFMGAWEDDPGDVEGWERWQDILSDNLDEEDDGSRSYLYRQPDMDEAASYLRGRGVSPDRETIRTFSRVLNSVKHRAARKLAERAGGDYSPDPNLITFPALRSTPPAEPTTPTLTWAALLALWAAERRPAAATQKKYGAVSRTIVRVLGFDDVRRVSPQDVVTFKQARLAEGTSVKTLSDDILAAGAVSAWAVKNRILTDNPFKGLAPAQVKRGEASRQGYSDEEARRILAASRVETNPLLRWTPWLMAFTGARISELVEMKRGHVKQEAGVAILDIRPTKDREGKNATFQRMLPLHPAVLSEGFLSYVAGLPSDPNGPLFPSLQVKRGTLAAKAATDIGRWIRKTVGITDAAKAPNHSWRHRMEDELRKVRALPEVQDAITGRHNPRNAGAGYGRGFRGMPDEVLKDLARVPSPLPPK
ncbi:hypothetical protein EOD42_20380 [Rhodovarius crocodyli]|uniref:Tyr recombinase domain-containing protein n=1 Tax=Rhodovarius crocodyli TaxID=1979269 RepID=A0A437M287_9PROT|nr:DUF6538 domain-containing protein [Rhodovarius crocodyli]RVT91686.1 hypothetical protein EOD42_20380 [Rhodovarius crocodyli]